MRPLSVHGLPVPDLGGTGSAGPRTPDLGGTGSPGMLRDRMLRIKNSGF